MPPPPKATPLECRSSLPPSRSARPCHVAGLHGCHVAGLHACVAPLSGTCLEDELPHRARLESAHAPQRSPSLGRRPHLSRNSPRRVNPPSQHVRVAAAAANVQPRASRQPARAPSPGICGRMHGGTSHLTDTSDGFQTPSQPEIFDIPTPPDRTHHADISWAESQTYS
eukprot:3101916-Pleurochrysis_carterae.AAC.2